MCRYVYIHVYAHTTYTHTQRTMICYTKSHQTFVVIAQILNNLLCVLRWPLSQSLNYAIGLQKKL